MIVGIPRALFFYKYKTMFETFFEELGIEYIVSDNSNKDILMNGKRLSPDESCLSLKLFLGHVNNLKNKCNYILIPRFESIRKNEKMCTNFYLLPDLVRNLFDINIIDFNVDESKKKTLKSAFISVGMYLGFPYNNTLSAYKAAVDKYNRMKNRQLLDQTNKINNKNKKILLAGHPYIIHDDYICSSIISFLEKNDFSILYSDICESSNDNLLSLNIYFSENKDIINAIYEYKDYISGIILLSTFPCGPDSIVNELIVRNISDLPIMNLIIDESDSNTGLLTRLESFIDIINKEIINE